jgi:hypothetical protein
MNTGQDSRIVADPRPDRGRRTEVAAVLLFRCPAQQPVTI